VLASPISAWNCHESWAVPSPTRLSDGYPSLYTYFWALGRVDQALPPVSPTLQAYATLHKPTQPYTTLHNPTLHHGSFLATADCQRSPRASIHFTDLASITAGPPLAICNHIPHIYYNGRSKTRKSSEDHFGRRTRCRKGNADGAPDGQVS
jgi:hypothetical protein